MNPKLERDLLSTRRQFFGRSAAGIGTAALSCLLAGDGYASTRGVPDPAGGLPDLPHFAPKAKRVIYMFQSGAPSQIDLFDHKPLLRRYHGQDLPDTVRKGQRITGMTSGQDRLPVAASVFEFRRHGESGTELSELLPHTANVVDDVAFVKTVQTDAINHDPAITFIQSGFQQPGRPSMGSWVSYGLGSANRDLPGFVVLISQGSNLNQSQPLFSRLWGSGFLPSRYQGVKFRSSDDPGSVSLQSEGDRRIDAAQHAGRGGGDQPPALAGVRRPRDRDADRPVRDGVSHAVVGARAHGPVARA